MSEKELLQTQLSENVYYDLCKFVEELYMSDYDLLILMARKFFNLFCVFHKLNCEKYKRLGISYEHKGKIISNRSLPLLQKDLMEGNYKTIVIADDIIIHGRTIREVYNSLKALDPDIDVTFASYMRNEDEGIAYNYIRSKITSRHIVCAEGWRKMSDEIVRTFYMAGRPYISYLPFFTLDIAWKELMKKLTPEECLRIDDNDMKMYQVEAVLYTGKELKQFSCLKSCEICSLRLYHYPLIGKVLAIPYYNMDIVEDCLLSNISDFIRNNYLELKYQEILSRNHNAEGMRAMELEYVLSAWMAIGFFDRMGIAIQEWHREMELYNFYTKLLPDKIPNNEQISKRIMLLKQMGESMEMIRPKTERNGYLEQRYKKLLGRYMQNYNKWIMSKDWNTSKEDKDIQYLQRLVENHLAVNGDIDESNWREDDINSKRLYGISLSDMIDGLAEFFQELTHNARSFEQYKKYVFKSIIMVVDSGKGTIVKRIKPIAEHKYHESVLYAGEQNYKFYENTNFPVMYGLYLIEQNKPPLQGECMEEKKESFIRALRKYMDENNYFYIEEELQYLAQKQDMRKEYGVFLQDAYYKYCHNSVLKKSIRIALDICKEVNDEN